MRVTRKEAGSDCPSLDFFFSFFPFFGSGGREEEGEVDSWLSGMEGEQEGGEGLFYEFEFSVSFLFSFSLRVFLWVVKVVSCLRASESNRTSFFPYLSLFHFTGLCDV